MLKRNRDLYTDQLAQVVQSKRRASHDETLKTTLSESEARLKSAQAEVLANQGKLASFQTELDHVQVEKQGVLPELEKLESELASHQVLMDAMDAKVIKVEKSIFASFCVRLNE